MGNLFQTILATVFVLGVLVFIHELGHLLAAKLFKIRVDRFSLGFPPRLFGRQMGETDYCISAIPIGGYAKIAGMVDESMDVDFQEGPPQPWEFRSRPWYQKTIVICAGSMMNLLLAFMLFTGIIWVDGIEEVVDPWDGSVLVAESGPAFAAGMRNGDRITAVNGDAVVTFDKLADIVRPSLDQEVTFTWQREDSVFTSAIVPEATETLNKDLEPVTVGMIGIQRYTTKIQAGFVQSVRVGWELLKVNVRLFGTSWGRLLTGKESLKSLSGPVKIAELAGQTAKTGWVNLLGFMAFISVHLGLLNLMPIPVLDGGHLVFINVEAVLRRTISVKTKLIVQQIGMLLVFGLMIFVVYNDIVGIVHK